MRTLPALLLLLSACSSAGGGPPPPDGWKTAGNSGSFTFNLPNEFVEKSAGDFKTETTTIHAVNGRDANPLDVAGKEDPSRTVDSVIVESWPARVVRWHQPAEKTWTHAIHVWGWDKKDNTSLTLSITSTVPLSTSFTNTVFSSIHLAASGQ